MPREKISPCPLTIISDPENFKSIQNTSKIKIKTGHGFLKMAILALPAPLPFAYGPSGIRGLCGVGGPAAVCSALDE